MMKNKLFYLSHLFLLLLIGTVVLLPNQRTTSRHYASLLVGIGIIELLFLASLYRKRKRGDVGKGLFDIITFVWIILILWELTTSVWNVAHPVLVPAPENVFDTFRQQWRTMLLNVWYSMRLLLLGFSLGLVLGVILGLFAGWIPRVRNFAYPIANVMAPIPPIVFSPYLVALMPSFWSASVLVLLLGVFWPTFLGTINRITSMEPQILDSARMLHPSTTTMVWNILLPYIFPSTIAGLKVSMTTSLLMLNYAELMGASHGMGYYVQNSIAYANYTHAVAGMIVIGIVVTLLSFLVTQIQKHVIRWH
ncbi:MAG: ABC transporter permease [Oscillospiraceae bacterium]|jgi:NitT/TauT family transport system permease protein